MVIQNENPSRGLLSIPPKMGVGTGWPRQVRRWRPHFLASLCLFATLQCLAVSAVLGSDVPANPKTLAPPNLILITLDTTRNDAVGALAGRPSRTPVLDELATQGVRFLHALAPTPLTLPSHASLLTGLDPPEHGLRDNGSFALPKELPTLATVLADRGYLTAAFVATRVLDRRFGLARGFATYDDRMVAEVTGEYGYPERDAAAVVTAALDWLSKQRTSQPTFIWLHFYDPHAPYAAPGSDPRRPLAERYGDEVAFVDQQIGRLLAEVPEPSSGRIVAVVGDHGEALGEHGERTHGIFVYRSTLEVPLIIAGQGLSHGYRLPRGQQEAEPVAARRLAPTLLRLLTPKHKAVLPGTPLPGLGIGEPEPEPIYSESQMPARTYGWSPLTALWDGQYRLIVAPRPELYDTSADPSESRNVVREQRAAAGRLRDRLAEIEASFEARQAVPLAADSRLAADLRALGYLSGGGDRISGLDPKDGIVLLDRLEQANGMLANGQTAAALKALEELNASSPDNVPFLTRLAAAQERAGKVEQAISTFRRAIELDPDLEFLHHHLGRTLLGARRYDEAEKAFEAALAIDSRFSQAWLSLAELALHRRQPAEERAVLERAAAHEVESVAVHIRLAQLQMAAGEPGAERHLATACNLLPNLPLPWFLRGQIALDQGRRDDARKFLERAIENAPGSAIAGQAQALMVQLDR